MYETACIHRFILRHIQNDTLHPAIEKRNRIQTLRNPTQSGLIHELNYGILFEKPVLETGTTCVQRFVRFQTVPCSRSSHFVMWFLCLRANNERDRFELYGMVVDPLALTSDTDII